MIRPMMFEVGSGTGVAVDICFDDESVIDNDPYFKLDQNGESIIVTLRSLRELVDAAEQLIAGRKHEH